MARATTLRVGVKAPSELSLTTTPPARATIGAAAFAVYTDLVGGTDPIASTSWQTTPMLAGTPLSVTDSALMVVAFHANVASGTPSIKVRMGGATATVASFPAATLVTAGPVYTAQAPLPNLLLTFDDGTLGWAEPSMIFSTLDATGGTIGTGNTVANILRVPFACAIDMLGAVLQPSAGAAADFAYDAV